MSFIHKKINSVEGEKKRKTKKIVALSLLILLGIIAAIVGWVGYSASNALDKITDGDFSLKQFFQSTTLKNEDGRTNILLLGNGGSNHPGGQLTDTNLLLSYDHNKKQAAMISFPRDLQVKIANSNETNKLNYAYAYGEKNSKTTSGGEAAKKTVSNISGVEVHYYAIIDFIGFRELVDTLGGVTVNVEKAINDPYYPKDFFDAQGNYRKTNDYSPFYLKAGVQKLDGATALKYARSRETTSDFDRAARQQKLIMAMRDKALSLGILSNPKKVVDIIEVLGNHLRTDMSVTELKEFITLAKDLDMGNIRREVISTGENSLLVSTKNSSGQYVLLPKDGTFAQIKVLVREIFGNAENEGGVSVSGVIEGKIEVHNGTGTAGLARLLAPKLREKGFTVTSLKTATAARDDSILYDYTSGNSEAAVAMIKSLVPEVTVIKRIDNAETLDFKLILGKNYTGD